MNQGSKKTINEDPWFSASLEAWRFFLAVVVFFYHVAYERFSGTALSWLQEYGLGAHAVTGFFVLSGFLIHQRCRFYYQSGQEFLIRRASRIISVAYPAFFLTWLLDFVGQRLDPELYSLPWLSDTPMGAQIWRALTFSMESWEPIRVGTNGPLWSLNYEVIWYALMGAWFYWPRQRLGLIFFILLAAGPRVWLLTPVFLLGVGLSVVIEKGHVQKLARRWALLLAVSSLIFLALLIVRWPIERQFAVVHAVGGLALDKYLRFSATFWLDYVVGVLFALHFFALATMGQKRGESTWFRLAKWGAGWSFSLYCFHYPLLQFFKAVWSQIPFVILALSTLLCCYLLSFITERKREVWAKGLSRCS